MDDTHPAVAKMIVEGYRRMAPARRSSRVAATSHPLCASCRRPEFARSTPKPTSARFGSEWRRSSTPPSSCGARSTGSLNRRGEERSQRSHRRDAPRDGNARRVGVEYVVGGSVASSMYGLPRSTADSDIVAALDREYLRETAEALDVGLLERLLREA